MRFRHAALIVLVGLFASSAIHADTCVECHRKVTPSIVQTGN